MTESKLKSRSRRAVLAAEPRCIFCSGPPETIEHMPPRSMLRDRNRPSGMEFGACDACNKGTRGADVVAAVLARIHPRNGEDSWQSREMRKLLSALDAYAPGVRREFIQSGSETKWIPRPDSGLLQRVVFVDANGPQLKAHLFAFGSKLAMALYREHVGVALPLDGAAWCQFSLNAGMTQKALDERVQIMPAQATLRQGQRNVADQFNYRYNTDERTVVAAVVEFNRSLWFTVVASSDAKIIGLFSRPESLALPGSVLVRPGEILNLLTAT